jgi:hypothetical protein
LLDARVTGVNDDYSWLGPFMACPDGETTTVIENNFIFLAGTFSTKNGDSQAHSVQVLVQYRNAAVGGNWTQVAYSFRGRLPTGTDLHAVSGLSAAQYEVRVRRTTKIGGVRPSITCTGNHCDRAWRNVHPGITTSPPLH